MVPSKTMTTFDELNKVMHSTMNFSIYRERIHTVSLPCLPFLGTALPCPSSLPLRSSLSCLCRWWVLIPGVYLSDLTFIEDGNPNMLRNNDRLINFSKRMKTAEVIRDLQQYQTVPYPFVRVNELQAWLDNELTNSSEIQELYDLSTQVEPREREDEKMYLPSFLPFPPFLVTISSIPCHPSLFLDWVLTVVRDCCRRVGFYERLGYPPYFILDAFWYHCLHCTEVFILFFG